MTDRPSICGVCANPKRRAIRFTLSRYVWLGVASVPRQTTRAAGGLSLCEPCWRELTAGTRRRPRVAA